MLANGAESENGGTDTHDDSHSSCTKMHTNATWGTDFRKPMNHNLRPPIPQNADVTVCK